MESGSLHGSTLIACTACDLYKGARNVCVPSRGSSSPLILFVGEGPGKTEDQNNSTFVGRAGEVFDKLMERVGLDPSVCRWANVARCIPWETRGDKVRPPSQLEIDACCQYLDSEILACDPVFIVPLGATAASYFLGQDTKITAVRGKRHYVELPTIRYRYIRLMKQMAAKGIIDDKLIQMTPVGRLRAIERAKEQYGFKERPLKRFTIFPTWHPAAILHGNTDAEFDILNDLNVLVSKILCRDPFKEYRIMESVEEVVQRLRSLREEYRAGKFQYCAFDFESTSLEVYDPKTYITTMAFTPYREHAWIIPWDHHESPFKRDKLAQTAIQQECNATFLEVPVIGHNFKFDYELGYVRNFKFGKIYDDTELMSWTLFNDTIEHGLDSLASKYTDLKVPKQEYHEAQTMFDKDERYNTDNYDLPLIGRYNGGDADACIRMCPVFEKMLIEHDLLRAHRSITVASIFPTIAMEINGAPIDTKMLASLDTEMTTDMADIMKELSDMDVIDYMDGILNPAPTPSPTGKTKKRKHKDFSLTTPEHVSTLLFTVLGLRPRKEGKKGPSSDKNVLQELLEEANDFVTKLQSQQDSNEFRLWHLRLLVIKCVMGYKRIAKLHSSYVKNIPKYLSPYGYVHCSYGIRHTETGRFNCQDPSLHTIPFHSPVKKLFVSRFTGGLILSADASQMELRKFAMVTQDPSLVQAFVDNRDIHRLIASRVLGCSEDRVSSDDRRRIKTVVFGLLYGRGPKSVAAQEGISVERAKEIIAGVFKQFPRIKEYIRTVQEFVRANGYVRYVDGFRRIIPVDPRDPSKAERQAVNSTIQGPASDMTVVGMINMYNLMNKCKLYSKHWEFKHDDLAFDIAPGELLAMVNLTQKGMVRMLPQHFTYANVPLRVDYEVGVSWGHLVEMKIVSDNVLEFSGEQDYMDPLLSRIMSWQDTPCILEKFVKEKERPALVRSGMRISGEKVKYNHIVAKAQFPDFVRREPNMQYPGLTVAA